MRTQTMGMARPGLEGRRGKAKKGAFWRVMAMLALLLAAVWYVGMRPATPDEIVPGDVVALTDQPDGWRVVTVRLQDGEVHAIRTLAPFFFKPGYKAKVGIYKRPLMADQYDIVGDQAVSAGS